jgi:hypothetical protein
MHVNTYLNHHIHSPVSVFIYIVVHDGVGVTSKTCFCGVSAVDYTCGVCVVKVVFASCCCCFHGTTCVNFAITGVVDGIDDNVARVLVCFRLNNRVYAANCDNDVHIVSVITVDYDFDIAGGVKFNAGVDALCGGIVFLVFFVLPCFYGSGKAWREVRFFLVAWACQLSFAKFLMC